jgi:hypothetical protein
MTLHDHMVNELTKFAKKIPPGMRQETDKETTKRVSDRFGRIGTGVGALGALGTGIAGMGGFKAAFSSKSRLAALAALAAAGGGLGRVVGRRVGEGTATAVSPKNNPRPMLRRETRLDRLKSWIKHGPKQS